MGCKEVGHKHNWPTEGTLVIQRCEIRCNFCPGAKGVKPWKYAWFLRRHVRAMHCTSGRGKTPYPNLEVAITWKDKAPNTNKKAKSRKRTNKGEIKDEIKDEDVSSSDGESEGMAAPGAMSVGTNWIEQPVYADVPNQHPGDTGGFNTVNPHDVHFEQYIVLGNQDHKKLLDDSDILNFNDVGAFLNAQTESFVQFINEEDAPGARRYDDMDVKDEGDDNVKVASTGAELMSRRSATYFGLDDDGDAVAVRPDRLKFTEDDYFGNDRFFMSDCSEESNLIDDIPLAVMPSIAHSANTLRPPADGETAKMLNDYEQAKQAMLKQGMSSEQMFHVVQQFINQGT